MNRYQQTVCEQMHNDQPVVPILINELFLINVQFKHTAVAWRIHSVDREYDAQQRWCNKEENRM
jgi:hypothetical protein